MAATTQARLLVGSICFCYDASKSAEVARAAAPGRSARLARDEAHRARHLTRRAQILSAYGQFDS